MLGCNAKVHYGPDMLRCTWPSSQESRFLLLPSWRPNANHTVHAKYENTKMLMCRMCAEADAVGRTMMRAIQARQMLKPSAFSLNSNSTKWSSQRLTKGVKIRNLKNCQRLDIKCSPHPSPTWKGRGVSTEQCLWRRVSTKTQEH